MAATEDVEVFRVRIDAEGETVAELKETLKGLKEQVAEAKIGTVEYTEAVKALGAQETLLKEVMYQQKAAADDVGRSYNTLSAEMGRLKVAQKALDISTVEGRETFSEYGKQIKLINDELKALDEENGVYSRNVGDYANQFGKGFKHLAMNMPSFSANIRGPIRDIGREAHLLATNPIVGIAALLVPVISKITAELKENDTALAGIKRIMDAIQPVLNVITGALEKAVGWVAQMISKLGTLAGESTGTFKTIVTGAVGVGNAILQFLLMPIRNTIDGAKALGNVFQQVFKGRFKEAANTAKDAVKEIGENIKNGFAFKTNFQAGQKIGEEFAAGLRSKKTKETMAAAVQEVIEDSLQMADIDKALAEADRKADAARRKRLEDRKMVDEWFRDEDAALIDEIEGLWDEDFAKQQEDVQKQKELMEQRVDALRQVAGATSSILGSLADMYESNTDASERETKKAKALRIAAATIDMLQGAVTAYAAAQSLGVPLGPIVGAANAAAVIAAGTANIAKIKNTQVSKNGTTSTPTVSASVPAPSQPYTAPEQVRTITSASEEDRLNRMAEPSRVYILQSDIEAAGRASKVQVDESTF